MKQREFKAALKELGLKQAEAAEKLGVPGGKARISEWERGKRPIPPYIVAHIETLLALGESQAAVLTLARECRSEGVQAVNKAIDEQLAGLTPRERGSEGAP